MSDLAASETKQPWRAALGWVVGGGLALGAAFLAQSPFMAFSVYAFLTLVALAYLTSQAWVAGLESERSISETIIQQGESVEVTVTVRNHHGWPIPWLFVEDQHPPGAARKGESQRLAVMMPGHTITLKYKLTFPERGYHRIGPVFMESGDLFGLQKRFRTGEARDYVSVLPTVAYIDTYTIAARRPQGPIRIANQIYADPTRTSGLREYRAGDPLSAVHWKASARTGELFVKTFEPTSVTGGTVLLDLHDESYKPERKSERMELAVTVAASVAYLLQQSGEQVGLVTNGADAAEIARWEVAGENVLSREEAEAAAVREGTSDRLSPLEVPTLRSPEQAQRIIENLARVMPGHGLDAEAMARVAAPRLPRDASLLPVVPLVTERFALTLGALKEQGFAVTVFIIRDQTAFNEGAVLLAQHNIQAIHIEEERSLHEISPAAIGH